MNTTFTEAAIENLVYLDTMIWIDCAKSKEKQSSLDAWIKCRNSEILIHSNLAFELFNPKFPAEFDIIWDAIKGHAWSNFSPVTLISEELAYVLLGKPLSKLLDKCVFHFGKQEQEYYYNEYKTHGFQFYVDKHEKIAQENFMKISKKFDENDHADIPYFYVLNKMKAIASSNTSLDYSFFDLNLDSFLKKNAISEDVIASTRKLVDDFKMIDGNDFYNENLKKLNFMRLCGVKVDEKFTLGQFQEIDFLLEKAAKAYSSGLLENKIWPEIASTVVRHELQDFPGLCLIQKIANDIRKSNAKAKPSDQIDYLNLMYLPYVSLYITDAHIANIIKQRAPQFASKVISASEFNKELTTV